MKLFFKLKIINLKNKKKFIVTKFKIYNNNKKLILKSLS